MDATRQRLLPEAAHTRADRKVAYRGMHFAAELLLAAGAGAVLDAPYDQPENRAELARIAGSECKLIECHVTPGVAAARLRERGLDDPGAARSHRRASPPPGPRLSLLRRGPGA